jgi:hypothetical protein
MSPPAAKRNIGPHRKAECEAGQQPQTGADEEDYFQIRAHPYQRARRQHVCRHFYLHFKSATRARSTVARAAKWLFFQGNQPVERIC